MGPSPRTGKIQTGNIQLLIASFLNFVKNSGIETLMKLTIYHCFNFFLVTGLISPSELGKTMVHEHLSMNFDVAYVPPSSGNDAKASMPFTMENLGWIRYNPYSHKPNLKFNDKECESAVASELALYRAAGGGAIVECTTHGIQRKAGFLREMR